MRRCLFSLLLLVFVASAAVAHPLPNFRYDREIEIRPTPQKVEVRYVLLVSFWTIFTDSQKLFTPEEIQAMDGKMSKVQKAYCEKLGPLIAAKLDAKLNGQKLAFRATRMTVDQDREHAKLRYTFEAPWRVNGGGPDNTFTFEELNFRDDFGAVSTTVLEEGTHEEDRVLKSPDPPVDSRGLWRKDPSTYKPGDAERAPKASWMFTAPSLPPLPMESPATPQAAEQAPIVVEEQQDEGFSTVLLTRGPRALFDTNYGTGMLLLLAAVFGAFHAFAPGHGKSVAAAFLVGEQGTFRQAILLGLSTTFAHTGSVILIALIFYFRYGSSAMPQEAQSWLGFVGGLLVLFVGMWLFMRRMRGQVDHVHLFGSGCSDMCGNHEARPDTPQCRRPPRDQQPEQPEVLQLQMVPKKAPMSWVRVALLGIGAGAIPCVDAVLLLMLAVSAGKLAFALPLLVSFSIGLSAVLALIGVFVVLLHRAGASSFRDRAWLRFLPTASAVLLMGMGLWMARDAWKGMSGVG